MYIKFKKNKNYKLKDIYVRRYYTKPQSGTDCQGVNILTVSTRLNRNHVIIYNL